MVSLAISARTIYNCIPIACSFLAGIANFNFDSGKLKASIPELRKKVLLLVIGGLLIGDV